MGGWVGWAPPPPLDLRAHPTTPRVEQLLQTAFFSSTSLSPTHSPTHPPTLPPTRIMVPKVELAKDAWVVPLDPGLVWVGRWVG